MDDIVLVEDLLTLNVLLHVLLIVDGNIIGETVRRSVREDEKFSRPLRYNNHICYMSNINAVFQSLRCPKNDTFCNRTFNLERHLTACGEQV